jgi:hypothetical protein
MTSITNAIALEIAIIDARIKADSTKLAAKKAELIAEVGTEGATIETALAKVQVTRQTESRKTGTFSFSLNTDNFNTLDERIQANLIKQGVVSKTEKVISGSSPTVKVLAK